MALELDESPPKGTHTLNSSSLPSPLPTRVRRGRRSRRSAFQSGIGSSSGRCSWVRLSRLLADLSDSPSSGIAPNRMAQSNWEADKMLDVYIYDYLLKRNLQATAKAFMAEGKVAADPV
ncbi:hypothetical protein GUJ93_ZPchr0004g39944, partial [Zizania palustris]